MKKSKLEKIINEVVVKEVQKKKLNNKYSKLENRLYKKINIIENQISNIDQEKEGQNKVVFSREDKQMFLEKIKQFENFGKILYELNNYKNISKELSEICENAERYVLSENGDWFDSLTVKRNIKELKSYYSDFNKTSNEAQMLQERLLALYEDIGVILNRYFAVGNKEGSLLEKK